MSYLSNFGVQKCDESEGSERLRDKDICDLAILGKVISEVVSSHVLSATSNENLARNLLDLSFL